ncbi:MAG: outer membrane protein assembly factor BamA [Candidatus Omnitrophota bacterium]
MLRRIAIPLGFILILSALNFSFAQEEPALGEQATLATEEAPAKLVTAIDIKGNKNISTNTVISKMKTRVGSPYQENIISDDLKRLYLLGFFSDIKIDTEPYKDGVKVIITVAERSVIEKITFVGIRRLTMKEDKIKESLRSKESQYLDYSSLVEDTKNIKKLYEKIGYSQAEVSYKADVNKDTGRARVEFSIVEGKRIRVKNILVEGNKHYSDKRILKLMKTRRAWFFNAGALKDGVLDEDIERIKSFYRREGFADAAVDSEIKSDTRKPYLYITIRIQEGKKYLVGNVTIQGNAKISQNEILLKLKDCVPGKVFSTEALKQDIMNIQSLYFDRGYIFAQVQEATSLNSYTGRIDITYNIAENKIAYLDKIKVRGNIKTKDVVIRRELRIKPGDKFDGEKLKRSKERLQNLGFFEEVNYDTEDTNVPDKKDLVVEVKESKTGAFSFGGGYSSVDAFVGFVEVEQKNFDWKNFPYFTGAGQNLKLRASLGTISESFDLSFTEPWVFDYPVSFGFDLYKRTHKRETDIGYGYSEETIGGDLRLGKELSEYVSGSLVYRHDIIDITDITDSATSNDLRREYGKNTVSSGIVGLIYNSTDNVFDPTRGDILSGSLECAGGPFAGDKEFFKVFSRGSHYVPLPYGSVLEFRGRLGMGKPYGDSDIIPIYERFFAGGAYTIRGYDERQVGPLDITSEDPLGGESLLVGNVEYTYPLFSFIKVAGFYDVGNVWSQMSKVGSGGFKSGVGLGVRIKTPMGPVMLDYGIPMDKVSGEEKRGNGKFHFNMSHGF